MGALFDEAQETSEAIKYYLKSIKENPNNHITYFNLGISYKKKNKL